MNLQLKVYVYDEYFNNTLISIIEVSPKLIQTLLTYMEEAQTLSNKYKSEGLNSITFFDNTPDFYSISGNFYKEIEESIEKGLSINKESIDYEHNPECEPVYLDTLLLNVRNDNIYWSGDIKNTTTEIETEVIYKNTLENLYTEDEALEALL